MSSLLLSLGISLSIYLQSKPLVVEPIDFEAFIAKNKTLIQNDPQRELLIYPADDVSVSLRTLKQIKDIRFNLFSTPLEF